MPSLAELQEQLTKTITGRSAAALDPIVSDRILSAERRLAVYSDAYVLRLVECLAADFPALRRTLGDAAFRRLAAEYLRRHPSTSPNVSDLGEALPDFIRMHPLAKEHPYLPDLIRLEWEVLQSLYTDRLPALDAAALKDVPADAWSRVRFTLDSTVRLLKTEWAVDSLWEKRRQPEEKGSKRKPKKISRYLLLCRDDDWLKVRVIDEPRWFTLMRFQEGMALGTLCEQLAARFHRRKLPITNWFTDWIHAGVIKKIEF